MCVSAATVRPSSIRPAPGPWPTTTPAISWPNTIGGGPKLSCAHLSQRSMWTSVPQTDAASTRTRISPGPGCGMGTSRTAAPGAAFSLTSARMVVPMPGADASSAGASCAFTVCWSGLHQQVPSSGVVGESIHCSANVAACSGCHVSSRSARSQAIKANGVLIESKRTASTFLAQLLFVGGGALSYHGLDTGHVCLADAVALAEHATGAAIGQHDVAVLQVVHPILRVLFRRWAIDRWLHRGLARNRVVVA